MIEVASDYPEPIPPTKTTDDFDYNVPLGLHAIDILDNRYFPYAERPRDLETMVPELEKRDGEFCFSFTFHPDWIEQVSLPADLQ